MYVRNVSLAVSVVLFSLGISASHGSRELAADGSSPIPRPPAMQLVADGSSPIPRPPARQQQAA